MPLNRLPVGTGPQTLANGGSTASFIAIIDGRTQHMRPDVLEDRTEKSMKETLKQQASSHTRDLADSWAKELPTLDLSNFLLAIYLMRLGRLLDNAYDDMCRKKFKISGADMRVLLALRRAGKPYARRPTDLFRSLLVTSGAITKKVDRLSKKGLVERRSDPDYSGGLLVQLTARGMKVVDSAIQILTEQSTVIPAVQGLSNIERMTAVSLCERMLIELDKTIVPSPTNEHYGRRGRATKAETVR
jgi:DNA-binding MarR family transcriptional regulator